MSIYRNSYQLTIKSLNYSDDILRDLPETPQSDYVLREQFNNTICKKLKEINASGGHILVHGMPGSGKTVAVCQAVRQLIVQENYFKPHGCYWIKIGINQLTAVLVGLVNTLRLSKPMVYYTTY